MIFIWGSSRAIREKDKAAFMPIRSTFFTFAALTILFLSSAAQATWFDEVDPANEFGTGDSRVGIVIDFNNGLNEEIRAFILNFDGALTAEVALRQLAANPASDVYFRFGVAGGIGVPLFGIGLDLDDDGFGLSDPDVPMLTFSDGVYDGTESGLLEEDAAVTDMDDIYREGWPASFWGFYFREPDADWSFAPTGISGYNIEDDDFIGFSFAPSFVFTDPSFVPEPASFALIGLGGLALLRRRRPSAEK